MKKVYYLFSLLIFSLTVSTAQNVFTFCDTECRSFPLGDCASGHTDSDNIEWPCDITLDDPNFSPHQLTPDDLEQISGINLLDVRPEFVNLDPLTMAVALTFEDHVFILNTDGFKIIRKWTVIEWFTGQSASFTQIIKNTAPINTAHCDVMVCNSALNVALANTGEATIWATDILEGDYSLCQPENFTIDVQNADGNTVHSGVGSVTVSTTGTFTGVVTNPTNSNSCWMHLIISDLSGTNCDIMVCNSAIDVTIAQNPPEATIWAADILEGDYSLCQPENFTIAVQDINGNAVATGVGEVTISTLGTYTAVVTNPTNSNSCWTQLTISDHTSNCREPLFVCDTECRTFPLGDCNSGHTDSDQIEWPCDVNINLPGISAQQLTPKKMRDLQVADYRDASPQLVNYVCNLAAISFEDQVFNLNTGGYKIQRTWHLLDWNSGNAYSYNQIIKNTAAGNSNCGALACNDNIAAAMTPQGTVQLTSDVFLEGSYPNCDLSTFLIEIRNSDNDVIASSTGSVNLTSVGTYTYQITNPADGNSCWGQLTVENKFTDCDTPFVVCDTKCRTEPVGDCDSGHTDTDNIEWPCNITGNWPSVTTNQFSPENMRNSLNIDPLDSEPSLVNYNCDLIAQAYEDNVFINGADGFEIVRTWIILDWKTGNSYTYTQSIVNTAPQASSCAPLTCYSGLTVELTSDGNGQPTLNLFAADFLEGSYPNCDLSSFSVKVTDDAGQLIADGTGMVTLDQVGNFTYTITEPATNNTCIGSIVVKDDVLRAGTSSVQELNFLEKIKVYPNPAKDVVNFDYEKTDLPGDVIISLFDLSGKNISTQKNIKKLNIDKLVKGLYIYQIQLNDEIRQGKISVSE